MPRGAGGTPHVVRSGGTLIIGLAAAGSFLAACSGSGSEAARPTLSASVTVPGPTGTPDLSRTTSAEATESPASVRIEARGSHQQPDSDTDADRPGGDGPGGHHLDDHADGDEDADGDPDQDTDGDEDADVDADVDADGDRDQDRHRDGDTDDRGADAHRRRDAGGDDGGAET